jgi:prevent-host-death family protein
LVRTLWTHRSGKVIVVLMNRASLVEAKAHLSEIVDAAEHRGVSTVIHRHGKPVAALVPLSLVTPAKKRKTRGMSQKAISSLFARLEKQGDQTQSAVQDLIDGRR